MAKKTAKKTKLPVRKFPYQLEYCPNPDCIQIHARSRFPESDVMDSTDLRFLSKRSNRKAREIKRHPLYIALAKIGGLKSASGGGYTLQLVKADLFSWDKLIPKVLKAVQENVARKRVMVPVGKPKKSILSLEELRSNLF